MINHRLSGKLDTRTRIKNPKLICVTLIVTVVTVESYPLV